MCDNSKKRKKKFYGGNSFKKSKYAQILSPGIKGFLCTHNGHPKFCIREVYNLLDEFSEQKKEESSQSKNGDDSDDFEAELKRDLEKVKNESEVKEFQVVETGVTGCVFVKSNKCEPSEIVEKIIRRIIETKKCLSRKILRMLPIQVTCKAYLEDIKKAATPLFDRCFKTDEKTTYAIVINRRNNSHVLRDELLQTLGMMVRDRNPFHLADLKQPRLTVLVEILKNVCCLAIIADYNKNKKYNLIELGLAAEKDDKKENGPDSVKELNEEESQDTDSKIKDMNSKDKLKLTSDIKSGGNKGDEKSDEGSVQSV